jgi:hypothetical protein
VVGNLTARSVRQENTAIGETTNRVVRLQAIVEPDALVVSPMSDEQCGPRTMAVISLQALPIVQRSEEKDDRCLFRLRRSQPLLEGR